MLEKILAAILGLTEALNANTKAHGGKPAAAGNDDGDEGAGKATGGKATGSTRGKAKTGDDDNDDKPASTRGKAKKLSREDVTALLNKVKEDLGAPVAKELIKKVGGADRLAEVDDDDLDALGKAAQKKLDAADDKGGSDDDNL